jgi:hypothetical protein
MYVLNLLSTPSTSYSYKVLSTVHVGTGLTVYDCLNPLLVLRYRLTATELEPSTMMGATKRQRESLPDIEDILRYARAMWRRRDPYKGLSTQTENRDFNEFYGCGPLVALQLWGLLHDHDYLPGGCRLEHLLWMLAFLKIYGHKKQMCTICGGVDYKTMMKWILLFLDAVSSLEPFVVSGSDLHASV